MAWYLTRKDSMHSSGHSLVIDDKYDDGMLICSRLIENLTPCYFFQYDEQRLLERRQQDRPKLTGVRLIFQDLALTSQGEPSKTDYEAAALTIESIVSELNGPWLLVTWSTWAGAENQLGTQKAQEVFDHLRDSLAPGLRPFAFVVLDTKPRYSRSGMHGDVQRISDISSEQLQELSQHISQKVERYPATSALIDWESEVFRAISETVSEITSFIQPGEYFDADLGSVLREMALAEIGKNVDPQSLSKGLKEVLSSILRDKIKSTANGLENFEEIDDQKILRLEDWKAKTNRIIHQELSSPPPALPPGSLLDFSHNLELLPSAIDSPKELNSFIRKNFFQFGAGDCSKARKNEVSEACSFIALDITPPCDHAQTKSTWNKYIIGISVPEQYIDYCRMIDKKTGERTDKLLGEYLVCLPEMMNPDGPKYFLVFNSRLTLSIDTDKANSTFADHYKGRLREQMLGDLTSWLIRQTTRPGIVELR